MILVLPTLVDIMPETSLSRITLLRLPVAVVAISVLLVSGVFNNQAALSERPSLSRASSANGIVHRHLSYSKSGRTVHLEVIGTGGLEVTPWMSEIKKELRMGASQVDLRVFDSADWEYQGLLRVAKNPSGPGWTMLDNEIYCQIERHALHF
ncbi:MAG: hypothetical protein H3C47_15625 [Candidatus Cloacimonetes bacterium]|nr:hypothetical protein [Candidatus Cloacimonadota bacterium]